MTAPRYIAMPLMLAATLGLAACGGYERDYTLRKIINTSNGPDEFNILPNKPLETPVSFAELPPPTPGQGNRTDLQPQADAVAALGGRPEALADRGVSTSDGALVNAASRSGRDPNIRATLAAEDEDFRRRKSRWSKWRIFAADQYYPAYEEQSLDSQRTLQTWRRAGAPTPSAPPSR